MTETLKVSVIGLGYIGLPTAALMAAKGLHVAGVDVSASVVDTINQGKVHIVEPGLEAMVQVAVASNHLRAVTKPEAADVFVIAVPTPFEGTDHTPDLSYVMAAASSIAAALAPGNLVILESTSPVGATEELAAALADARPDLSFPQTAGDDADIHIAYCPERVLPGKIIEELIQNDRVIGGMTPTCTDMATRFYQHFVQGDCVAASGPRAAEMAKLTENSFRDVNIAFANELSKICHGLDIDVWELTRLANRHPRVNILQPGPGVGGHCIAVDPWFIVSSAPDQAPLITAARHVNDSKPAWVVDRILEAHPSDKALVLYGLTYKPDVDDLRESPAVAVAAQLQERVQVQVVDPFVAALPDALTNCTLVPFEDSLEWQATRVLLVPHSDFRAKQAELIALDTLDFCGALR